MFNQQQEPMSTSDGGGSGGMTMASGDQQVGNKH